MTGIYPWQNEQWQRLMEMQQQHRLPHAILLCGPEGIGLKQFAQTAAMQLLCLSKDPETNNACGKCQSCPGGVAFNVRCQQEPNRHGSECPI